MTILSGYMDISGADGYDVLAADIQLTVAAGADIVADTTYAGIGLGFLGFASVINDGSINAGVGIEGGGPSEFIWNSALGQIMGYYSAISSLGGNVITENDGTLFSQESGIYVTGGGNETINKGEISANTGIYDDVSGSDFIENLGVIVGLQNSIKTTDSGAATVENFGTLDGNVLFQSPGTTLTNRGAIDGNVQFGAGTNIYNGRVGTVTGAITGGAGNDTFHLGADGETADGGAGMNVIYGGAGADTFIFSALGTGDQTNIIGFQTSIDKIELESSVFTKLVAGATPMFAIATAATGPHDYLFYNSATGGLYYDADGSHKGAAVLLGDLRAGLHLTARNFIVV